MGRLIQNGNFNLRLKAFNGFLQSQLVPDPDLNSMGKDYEDVWIHVTFQLMEEKGVSKAQVIPEMGKLIAPRVKDFQEAETG